MAALCEDGQMGEEAVREAGDRTVFCPVGSQASAGS